MGENNRRKREEGEEVNIGSCGKRLRVVTMTTTRKNKRWRRS